MAAEDLGWVTIPTEEFERLHAEIRRLQQNLAESERFLYETVLKMREQAREIDRLYRALSHS